MGDSLKIGDVRKFEKGNKEVIAVVIAVRDSFYDIYDIDGWTHRVPKNVSYSSVKLDSSIRKPLEEVGFYSKKIKDMEEEYRLLTKKIELYSMELEKAKIAVHKQGKSKNKKAKYLFGWNDVNTRV